MITIINRQRTIPVDREKIESLLAKALKETGYEDYDLGVMFTNNRGISIYNARFRSKKGPTDILSFRFHPDIKPGEHKEDKNIGDLILSLEYIKEHNKNFNERLKVLLIHGLCHLLGYDHETEEEWEQMEQLENDLLEKVT